MVIECAFGRLKARFGMLKRALDVNLDDVTSLIYVCFVLYNFCVMEEHIACAIDYERRFQPASLSSSEANNAEGKRVRRALACNLDP